MYALRCKRQWLESLYFKNRRLRRQGKPGRRAGEQGRGFAVVADEVRTLASRTQESTESIRSNIEQLQSGTTSVVTTVSRSQERVGSAIEHVSQTNIALNDASKRMSLIKQSNTEMAQAAQSQGREAEKINHNVQSVNDLSMQVSTQAEQTAIASEDLAKLGAELQDMVSGFKVTGS